jgi:hypothetical protein
MNHGLVDPDLYFDIYNPAPFWQKAKPIIEGMRAKMPHIYEKFEILNNKRSIWKKERVWEVGLISFFLYSVLRCQKISLVFKFVILCLMCFLFLHSC